MQSELKPNENREMKGRQFANGKISIEAVVAVKQKGLNLHFVTGF